MPSLHAELSPSGAKLDLKCAGNRREQRKVKRSRNESADRGTGAHRLGESCLRHGDNALDYLNWWCGCNDKGADFLTEAHPGAQEIANGVAAFKVDAKMATDVQMYIDEVRKAVGSLPGSKLGIEITSKINDKIWGTSDAVIMQYYGSLHIIDYKNGVTYVDVFWNPQLILYAAGIILMYAAQGIQFTDVQMTIVQPNTREGAPVRSFGPITPAEILKWKDETYMPAANKCLDPNALCTPGTWCKDDWCDARHICPTLAGFINQKAQGMFSPVVSERPASLPAPIQMTSQQRATVLKHKALVSDWMNKVYEHEYSMHKQGRGTWGKLVKGQNSRKWANPNTADANVRIMLGDKAYTPGKLKSPAQVEAELKTRGFSGPQANAKIKDMVSVLPGQPRLVAADAPGTTVNPVEEMFTNH